MDYHVCFTCVSRMLHVFTTCVTRGCPWAKFWAVQNFLPRPTPFRFFSASYHVYKSTVARLKLDINAKNIVCFTGDNFLTGFGRDQAVKRCVAGPLHTLFSLFYRQSLLARRAWYTLMHHIFATWRSTNEWHWRADSRLSVSMVDLRCKCLHHLHV